MLDRAIDDDSGILAYSGACGAQLYQLDGKNGRFELLVMQIPGNMVPGTSELLVCLFDDSIPFDTEYKRASSRVVNYYETEFVDKNKDGILDLVYYRSLVRSTNIHPKSRISLDHTDWNTLRKVRDLSLIHI